MSDRSDHLIERAAALLRTANAGHLFDGSNSASHVQGAGSGATQLAKDPKLSIPPRRFGPLALPRTGDQAEASAHQGSTQIDSVADLKSLSRQNPVSIAALEQAGLMVARTTRTRTSEEYRIVIGRILRALHEGDGLSGQLDSSASPNVVMVTSARPGEGKSFTSLNLGGSIAQNAGESVLVVDVDAKNNSLSDILGLSGRKGFLDLVADPTLSPDDLVVPSELANLSFLPLGSRSVMRQTGDGIGIEERRLTPPIQRLARRFAGSLILLDAPPCLSTSDPHTLSPAVGQVVIVVEAERTQRSEVEAAIDMIRICPNITMLLNKVRVTSSHTFGSYDYFGSYT